MLKATVIFPLSQFDNYRKNFSTFLGNFSTFFRKTLDFIGIIVYNIQALSGCSADGSVLGSGPRGRGFKSRHSDHLKRSRKPYLSKVCGFFFFSNSRFWGLFGVYCFKKFIFSGFIFIKISELASSTNSKKITVHFLRCTVFFMPALRCPF